MSKRRKKQDTSFFKWIEETYGIILPPEFEAYVKNLRNLKPTETIIQTPRGYYILKNPPSQ